MEWEIDDELDAIKAQMLGCLRDGELPSVFPEPYNVADKIKLMLRIVQYSVNRMFKNHLGGDSDSDSGYGS